MDSRDRFDRRDYWRPFWNGFAYAIKVWLFMLGAAFLAFVAWLIVR